MPDTSLVVLGATACALSGVFGWIAMKTQREHRAWCARATRADGVVSRLAERRGRSIGDGPGRAMIMVPIVRFRATDGIEYEIDAPEAPREIGSVVELAYDPALPSGGRAVSRTPKVGCAVLFFVAGVIFVAVGISR